MSGVNNLQLMDDTRRRVMGHYPEREQMRTMNEFNARIIGSLSVHVGSVTWKRSVEFVERLMEQAREGKAEAEGGTG